jgi:hypothetical protein
MEAAMVMAAIAAIAVLRMVIIGLFLFFVPWHIRVAAPLFDDTNIAET